MPQEADVGVSFLEVHLGQRQAGRLARKDRAGSLSPVTSGVQHGARQRNGPVCEEYFNSVVGWGAQKRKWIEIFRRRPSAWEMQRFEHVARWPVVKQPPFFWFPLQGRRFLFRPILTPTPRYHQDAQNGFLDPLPGLGRLLRDSLGSLWSSPSRDLHFGEDTLHLDCCTVTQRGTGHIAGEPWLPQPKTD